MAYTYEYPRAAVTADILLLKKKGNSCSVLLIERKRPPFEGMWALPGGFLEMNETLEETAQRELQEETSITGVQLEQFHTFSNLNRDPRHRTITTVYYGFAEEAAPTPSVGDDAAKAEWFSMDALPPLAFDHSFVIEMAKTKLEITFP